MAVPSKEIKDLRARKTYIHRRLPRIREEIKSLAQERKDLLLKLNDKSSKDPKALKNEREQSIYTRLRLEILRQELKELSEERQKTTAELDSKQANTAP
jgi:hypothetical protein